LLTQPAGAQTPPATPAIPTEAVQRYISDHPDIFADRKIFTLDQLVAPNPLPPGVAEKIAPAKSVDEVVAVFDANGVKFTRRGNRLDAVGADPGLIAQVMKMGPDDMFAVAVGANIFISKVTRTEVVPLTGSAASAYAEQLIRRQAAIDAAAAKATK
jgi:hypothetical protein